MSLLFGFLTSPYEWGVVLLLAMLFFGNRLPGAMRSLGEGVTEFKKGMNGEKNDDEDDSRPPKDLPRKPEGLDGRVNGDSRMNGDSRVSSDGRKFDDVRKSEERPV